MVGTVDDDVDGHGSDRAEANLVEACMAAGNNVQFGTRSVVSEEWLVDDRARKGPVLTSP